MKIFPLIFILLITIKFEGFSQLITDEKKARIVFYNVENLFDNEVDTIIDYNQYNPHGDHIWTYYRYQKKLIHLYKVLVAMGQKHLPALVGLAEVENGKVLNDLLNLTPLKYSDYKIIHYESGDHRGIDVALLYNKEIFKILFSEPIHIKNDNGKLMATRDILYVKGILAADTIHFFVNHWPSPYGGLMKTEPKRRLAATILGRKIDSVFNINKDAKVIVMGDFNEGENGKAIAHLVNITGKKNLLPINYQPLYRKSEGSIKHKQKWFLFDRFLLSASLVNKKKMPFVKGKTFYIFDEGFLLKKDEKYGGWKTNRTYNGFKYNGGFSDHLPVFIDLYGLN